MNTPLFKYPLKGILGKFYKAALVQTGYTVSLFGLKTVMV
jgi:hypothetical protein